jgi:hypothetical protein
LCPFTAVHCAACFAMGIRLYPHVSDEQRCRLAGVADDLVKAHHALKLAFSNKDDLDYKLYLLAEAIPALSEYRNLELYGFGRFDLDLIPPEMDVHCDSVDIDDPLAAALLDSAGGPPVAQLKAIGCEGLYWC